MPLPSSCSAWVVCALSSFQCALAADNRQPCRRQSLGPLGILREAPGKSLWSSRGNTTNLGWGEIAQFAEDSAWASKVGKRVRCGGSCYDSRLQRGSWRIPGMTRPFCLVNERLDFNKHEMALEEQQLKVTISGLHMHIQTYVCIQTHLTPHTHTHRATHPCTSTDTGRHIAFTSGMKEEACADIEGNWPRPAKGLIRGQVLFCTCQLRNLPSSLPQNSLSITEPLGNALFACFLSQ